MQCRSCGSKNFTDFCNLGQAPPSNSLVLSSQLGNVEPHYPLITKACEECFLVQTQDFVDAREIFTADYVYFSSYSSTWIKHAEKFVHDAVSRFNLDSNSFVVELASNDGYLLQFVTQLGIKCLGVEPTKETAIVAESKGIKVINDFFSNNLSYEIVSEYGRADLIVANNILAHVPDPANILRGISNLLQLTGVASIEFHSLQELIARVAIDTIYHEHFSYYSLCSFKKLAESAELKVVDAQELDSHGGSLRVFLTKRESQHVISSRVEIIMSKEYQMGLNKIDTYRQFSENVVNIKDACLTFLLEAKERGLKVAGYGAAAKASTLLNYAKVSTELLPFIADISPNKIGKHIPGCRIPIVDVDDLIASKPDYVVIFPWNIKNEIIAELAPRLSNDVKFFQLLPKVTLIS